MARMHTSYSFGTKYESWDLAKRAIEDFQIINVLSIVCPRQQNNTKDSENKSPRHGARDRVVIITTLLTFRLAGILVEVTNSSVLYRLHRLRP